VLFPQPVATKGPLLLAGLGDRRQVLGEAQPRDPEGSPRSALAVGMG
jgi:hypothetical protein